MKPFPVDPNLPRLEKIEEPLYMKTGKYPDIKFTGPYTRLTLKMLEEAVADLFIKNERS